MAKEPSIQKIKAQLKGVLIGLKDLQNRSKTTILIFTNIMEEDESTRKDCATAHFPSILV